MSRPEGISARAHVVLEMVIAAAEAGAVCPSNTEFADHINDSYAGEYLALLERRGLVRVDRGRGVRVVTINATGKSTAWAPFHPNQGKRAPGAKDMRGAGYRGDPPAHLLVSRDPCPRCGVRSNVGCRHSRAPLVSAPAIRAFAR